MSSRVESWNESWMWSRPAFLERRDALLVQADAGGDQVRVEAELARFGDEISRSSRISGSPPEKPELHGAERARLAQHTQPVLGRELVAVAAKSTGL